MKKLDEKGSTIITGVVIVMIIFVILGTALGIAMNYQKRSINEHARKQAYLNAVSIVDTIAGQIANGSNDSFIPQTTTAPITVTDIQLPDSRGGTVTATISLDTEKENIIHINVTSTYNKQTEKIELRMQKYQNKWYKLNYSQGDDSNEET